MEIILLVIIASSFLIVFFVEIIAVQLRISGGLVDAPHLANHVALSLLLIGRAFTAIGLLTIGYELDRGANIKYLILAFASFSLGLYFFLILWKKNEVNFEKLIVKHCGITCDWVVGNKTCKKNIKKDLKFRSVNFLIGICVTFAFCMPPLLAAIFVDYRATLLQLGFVLNSVATLSIVFYVEKGLAKALHMGDKNVLTQIGEDHYIARKNAAAFSCLVMLMMYCFV